MQFARLEPLADSVLHAEGEWRQASEAGAAGGRVASARSTARSPPSRWRSACARPAAAATTTWSSPASPSTARPRPSSRRTPTRSVRCHLAHIRPDVNMGDLLKDTPGSQLFTVFGLPRVELRAADGRRVRGRDGGRGHLRPGQQHHPRHRRRQGRRLVPRQRLRRPHLLHHARPSSPTAAAWEKLARALKTVVDPERFAAFSGTRSLPFPAGEHRRVAVKVIDPRGNEVHAGAARWMTEVRPMPKHQCRPGRAAHPAGRQARSCVSPTPSRPSTGSTTQRPGAAIRHDRPPPGLLLVQDSSASPSQQLACFAEEEREDLPLVNALREDVKRWRAVRLRGRDTRSPRSCCAYWWRADRPRRLFFCQLEAVETIIYLNEIRLAGRRPRFKPRSSRRRLDSGTPGPAGRPSLSAPHPPGLQDGDRQRQDRGHGHADCLGLLQPRPGAQRRALSQRPCSSSAPT